MSHSASIVLHIWPKFDTALSCDPGCVAALLYLQLCVPGRFSVAYTTNPDLSPSGQLPFLTHGFHSVAGLTPIVKYLSHLNGAISPDEPLTPLEKAQATARIAHIESELGDLVAYTIYSVQANWAGKTRPVLGSMLSPPQRYYLPERIRDSYRPRLEAAQLWNLPKDQPEEGDNLTSAFRRPSKKAKEEEKRAKAQAKSERDQVIERARAFFGIYAKLLADKKFFYDHNDRPTSLDIIFAAHIHLLQLPLPDPLFRILLAESYPTFLVHAETVFNAAFPDDDSFPPTITHDEGSVIRSLVPRPKFSGFRQHLLADPEKEKRFALIRWGLFGLTALSAVVYLQLLGMWPIVVVERSAEGGEEAEIEADEEEELGDDGENVGGEDE